jgi:hypothetical protein
MGILPLDCCTPQQPALRGHAREQPQCPTGPPAAAEGMEHEVLCVVVAPCPAGRHHRRHHCLLLVPQQMRRRRCLRRSRGVLRERQARALQVGPGKQASCQCPSQPPPQRRCRRPWHELQASAPLSALQARASRALPPPGCPRELQAEWLAILQHFSEQRRRRSGPTPVRPASQPAVRDGRAWMACKIRLMPHSAGSMHDFTRGDRV